jgi:hypothetical protein
MNAIRNNPITLEDIKIAESIFGLDIGSLKGKPVCTKPTPVVSDYIAIPQEIIEAQKHVTLCMDTLDINGLKFFATVYIIQNYSEFKLDLNLTVPPDGRTTIHTYTISNSAVVSALLVDNLHS